MVVQALYQEMNGPESSPFSPERSRRLAVQEAATALACTLMPAIEPVTLVSIQPRQNSPLGQTVVRTNEQRQYAELWTRRYLEEQLVTVLAGETNVSLFWLAVIMMSQIHFQQYLLLLVVIS